MAEEEISRLEDLWVLRNHPKEIEKIRLLALEAALLNNEEDGANIASRLSLKLHEYGLELTDLFCDERDRVLIEIYDPGKKATEVYCAGEVSEISKYKLPLTETVPSNSDIYKYSNWCS